MTDRTIHFLIAGDAGFFPIMRECIGRINALHGTSRIYVYDWGLDDGQGQDLVDAFRNVTIKDWTANIAALRKRCDTLAEVPMDANHTDLAKRHNVKFRDGIRKRLTKTLIKYAPWSPMAKNAVRRAIFYEELLAQKIHCIRDLSQSLPDGALAFLDADIVLFDNIDDLYEIDFDAAITVKDEGDIDYAAGYCDCINSGAVYLGTDRDKRNAFLERWLAEARDYPGYLSEQAGLSLVAEKVFAGKVHAGAET